MYRKSVLIHRIVAETYIPNPNNLPQVNHKNLDKTDNRVENLEWVDNRQNQEHYHGENVGIRFTKHKSFYVTIHIGRRLIYVGCYKTLEEAKIPETSGAGSLMVTDADPIQPIESVYVTV